jgi:two-component system chemotaxis response regulator CheY
MAIDTNKTRILVVDDYETMLRITSNLLKQLGFVNIEEATNGEAALIMLRQQEFNLIISDWDMEPVSGLELLTTVRADPELRSIPFIMATAESKPENLIAAKQAGTTNYIIKPFNTFILKSKLVETFGEF